MYTLPVGLEHLQTGIEFAPESGKENLFTGIVLQADGPTTFTAWSIQPFQGIWRLADKTLRLSAYHNPSFNPGTPETTSMVRERVERNNILQRV